ncbi:MAG: adenylate/guanylate cyclase domain-containing protein [Stellaceae bacterium]
MEGAPLRRRLSAVLLADVVGYSRLMSRDEEDTHRRLSELVETVFIPKVAQHGGRMIRSMGDGLLVAFDSAHDAVRCGLEVQHGLTQYNAAIAGARRIELRIGINTGDVIFDERDIYGNSVNIAARLESLADPGAVYVSAGVYDQLRGDPDLSFADRGTQWVKNIDHPIHVFRVTETDASALVAALPRALRRLLPSPGPWRSPVRYVLALGAVLFGTLGVVTFPIWRDIWSPWQSASILVLPFKNLSGDPGQDYFADAVTEELTTDLSRLRRVLVISAATAFTFKGKSLDTRQIGREIGVRYLLEGSVRRVDDQVETNARLVDAGSGTQLWADHFENPFVNLIALEAAITGRIANALDVQLVSAESRRVSVIANPDALDLRLRAESVFFSGLTPPHTLAARGLLKQAVRLDPSSAEAWARLAEITASDYLVHWNNAGPAQLVEAEDAVQQALALDPNLALAHFANGFVHHARSEEEEALESFSRAIALDPDFALAYSHKGNELVVLGHPDEAPPLVAKAIELSPRDPSLGIFYWDMGRAHFFAGRYGDAVPWLLKSVEMRPNLWFNRLYLASAYALIHQNDKAVETLADSRRRFPRLATLAQVEGYERRSPFTNPVAVAARARFHKGLLRAGMPAQ